MLVFQTLRLEERKWLRSSRTGRETTRNQDTPTFWQSCTDIIGPCCGVAVFTKAHVIESLWDKDKLRVIQSVSVQAHVSQETPRKILSAANNDCIWWRSVRALFKPTLEEIIQQTWRSSWDDGSEEGQHQWQKENQMERWPKKGGGYGFRVKTVTRSR